MKNILVLILIGVSCVILPVRVHAADQITNADQGAYKYGAVNNEKSNTTTPNKPQVSPNPNGTLVNPSKANAQIGVVTAITTIASLTNIFEAIYTSDCFKEGCVDMPNWVKSIFLRAPADAVLSLLTKDCDSDTFVKNAKVDQNATSLPSGCVLNLHPIAYERLVTPEKLASSGVLGYAAVATQASYGDKVVPVNLAYYINDVTKSSMLKNTALAQEFSLTTPDPLLGSVVYGLWKAARNIAMTFVALILGVGALGVIFRQKLGGQAVVTIYSILPYVPIVIFLILFSYPIMVIAMNLGLGINSILGIAARQIGKGIFATMFVEGSGGPITALWDQVWSGQAIVKIFGSVANNLAFYMAGVFPGVIAFFFLILFVILGVVIFDITILWQYAKTYMNFVYYTIFSPIIFLTALIPGKQNVLPWVLKKVAVEVLVLQYIIISFYLALAFLVSIIALMIAAPDKSAFFADSQTTTGIVSTGLDLIKLGISNMLTFLVLFSIAWHFIWGVTKARKTLETWFGVAGGDIWGPPQRR